MSSKTISREQIKEKYNEINRLRDPVKRLELLNEQSREMRAALWLENINRRTEGINFSPEQKDLLDLLKEKVMMVGSGKNLCDEDNTRIKQNPGEFLNKVVKILGRENLNEWFGLIGDGLRLKIS